MPAVASFIIALVLLHAITIIPRNVLYLALVAQRLKGNKVVVPSLEYKNIYLYFFKYKLDEHIIAFFCRRYENNSNLLMRLAHHCCCLNLGLIQEE